MRVGESYAGVMQACRKDTIGLVKASSDSGFTQQQDLNYAMAELKKQAAKLGANGVLLTTTGDKQSSAYTTYIPNPKGGGTFLTGTSDAQVVAGTAIYVPSP